MTKQKKRTAKKHKNVRLPSVRRRRVRIKPHKGPFQLELPLQMPLFPVHTVTSSPVEVPAVAASSSPAPIAAPATPAVQQSLLDAGIAS
jgi:hypothetical protein